MPQQISPWLEGAYGWNFGESGWNTGMDNNLLKFSFMFDRNVDSITASLPAAVDGQAHYLTTDNRLYFAVGTTYFSTVVPKWFTIYVRSTGQAHQFNGTSLVQIDTPLQLDSRLDAVELTVASLGTAAFQDIEFFATQAELDVAEANAAAYTDTLRSDIADTTLITKGASLVGWMRNVVNSVGVTLSRWLGWQPVSVLDFMTEAQRTDVLANTALIDVTDALQAARDHLAGMPRKKRLVFPAGTYLYSASPNWAINDAEIVTEGEVVFRYTGSGDCVILDAGAGTEVKYNVKFGRVFVEGTSTSGHGFFVRSVHHSDIRGVVRGCGTTKNALQVNFAVATTFDVIASVNENLASIGVTWFGTPAAKPLHGLYLDQRGVGEQVSACYFPKPVIEGVADTGIVLVNAIQNRFVGGTSEANTTGIILEAGAVDNTFDGIDLEVNSSNIGLIDKGDRNKFYNLLNSDLTQIQATAQGALFVGGIFNGISDSGSGTRLRDLSYGSNGGVISELGTGLTKTRVFNITGASFDADQVQSVRWGNGAPITKHLSATAALGFAAPSVPGFTAAQIISVPGAALGDTVVVSCSVAGSDLQFLDARVTAANSVSVRWGQLSGAPTTPGVGGETYRVDVWGH